MSRIPVSERALVQRINRELRHKGRAGREHRRLLYFARLAEKLARLAEEAKAA
jgi:hypothetical protein